eukprot:TRINITY_DN35991_c0_g1_i1.p1 TRINITY_DN35991_c0_g1~~TRINITY_DN35991_c0_g1_i1.p1  ORF type:complete len:300 (+),score=29.71 TRINITY_DN35991_c0_g1_i1:42-902(+)
MEASGAKRARMDEAACSVSDDPIITLNVGGKPLQTRCSTLVQSSSYFRNVLDGPFKLETGEVFLDCDAHAFEHALHFFRHGKLRTNAPLEDVRDIATLYSIDSLLQEANTERLLGTWRFKFTKGGKVRDACFTVYRDSGRLFYYELEGPGEVREKVGELKQKGEFSEVLEDWGCRRLAFKDEVTLCSWSAPLLCGSCDRQLTRIPVPPNVPEWAIWTCDCETHLGDAYFLRRDSGFFYGCPTITECQWCVCMQCASSLSDIPDPHAVAVKSSFSSVSMPTSGPSVS